MILDEVLALTVNTIPSLVLSMKRETNFLISIFFVLRQHVGALNIWENGKIKIISLSWNAFLF